ncbi:hypothetical protein ACTFIW_010244 [Dictyostelium discoideum]
MNMQQFTSRVNKHNHYRGMDVIVILIILFMIYDFYFNLLSIITFNHKKMMGSLIKFLLVLCCIPIVLYLNPNFIIFILNSIIFYFSKQYKIVVKERDELKKRLAEATEEHEEALSEYSMALKEKENVSQNVKVNRFQINFRGRNIWKFTEINRVIYS